MVFILSTTSYRRAISLDRRMTCPSYTTTQSRSAERVVADVYCCRSKLPQDRGEDALSTINQCMSSDDFWPNCAVRCYRAAPATSERRIPTRSGPCPEWQSKYQQITSSLYAESTTSRYLPFHTARSSQSIQLSTNASNELASRRFRSSSRPNAIT